MRYRDLTEASATSTAKRVKCTPCPPDNEGDGVLYPIVGIGPSRTDATASYAALHYSKALDHLVIPDKHDGSSGRL